MTDPKTKYRDKAYKGFVCIGNLWVKKKKGGGNYLGGFLHLPGGDKVRIAVFMNKNKRNSQHPDYSIFRHLRKSEREAICKEQGSSADPTSQMSSPSPPTDANDA